METWSFKEIQMLHCFHVPTTSSMKHETVNYFMSKNLQLRLQISTFKVSLVDISVQGVTVFQMSTLKVKRVQISPFKV